MKKLILLLLMSFLTISSYAQEQIDLVIWAGQSNAMGWQGDATYYPNDPNNLDKDIRLQYHVIEEFDSEWITMGPQVGRFDAGHFGPEVTFAREMVQNGDNPAIFKYSQGGVSIWKDFLLPGKGGAYDDMVAKLKTAIQTLEDQGHTVNICGLVWIQGEYDGQNDGTANAYETRLQTIIDDIRNEVNDNELPIVLGVDEQHKRMLNYPAVHAAHQSIASKDDNITFTSMYDFEKFDHTHLTPAGLEEHGKHVYTEFTKLKNGIVDYSTCQLSVDGTQVSSARESWGQSFTPGCSGYLTSIAFESATESNTPFTVTLSNGPACNAQLMGEYKLDKLVVGDNEIKLDDGLYLNNDFTYFLNVVSDTGQKWSVKYDNSNPIDGMMRTYLDGSAPSSCASRLSSFDMNLSVTIDDKPFPTKLSLFEIEGNDERVDLRWETVSEYDNSGFEVEKSLDGTQWTKIGWVDGNGTSKEVNEYAFTDIDLVKGFNYYRVKQVGINGEFEHSSVLKFEFIPIVNIVFDLVALVNERDIEIKWTTKKEKDNQKFVVIRLDENGADEVIGEVKSQGDSVNKADYIFIDDYPYQGKNTYKISQVGKDGLDTFSDTVIAEFDTPDSEIKFLSFDATVSYSAITLDWSVEEKFTKEYQLERSADGVNFEPVKTVKHTTNEYAYKDENPLSGVGYYRVKQVGINNDINYSDIVEVMYVKAYAELDSVVIEKEDYNEVKLSWVIKEEKTVENYILYRSYEDEGDFTKIATIEALGTTVDKLSYEYVDAPERRIVNYILAYTDNKGQEKVFDDKLEIDFTTSITEEFNQLAQVFPNPSNGDVIVSGEHLNGVSVYDAYGREVIREMISNHDEWSKDLSFLAKGLYVFVIETSAGQIIKKVIFK